MKILITGVAGFIGFHVAKKFVEDGEEVIGIDNMNNYYDVRLKAKRVKILEDMTEASGSFTFMRLDITNMGMLEDLCSRAAPTHIINLAAQAGVRYSLTNPSAYIESNLVGFANILEIARKFQVQKLVYASSSSVYGSNESMPLSESDRTDCPLSLYAATKKSNELMAHSYSELYGLETVGLRFFTVYGPWGRPDMALFLFTEAMINGKKLKLFNGGNMLRDFTYIDDIIIAIDRLVRKENTGEKSKIFNVGNGSPVQLMEYVHAIERALGLKGKYEMLEMQPGDVRNTHCDSQKLWEYIGFKPSTTIERGIIGFVEWYREYYGN